MLCRVVPWSFIKKKINLVLYGARLQGMKSQKVIVGGLIPEKQQWG